MNFKEKIEIDGYFYTILKNSRNKYKLVIDLLGLKGKFGDTSEKIGYINNLISEESNILDYLDIMTTQPEILRELLLHNFDILDLENFNITEANYIKVVTDILLQYSLESLNLDKTPLPIKLSNICSYIENSTKQAITTNSQPVNDGVASIQLNVKSEEELEYYKYMVSYLLHNPNLPEELVPIRVLYNVPNLIYDTLPIVENILEKTLMKTILSRFKGKETTALTCATTYFQALLEEIFICGECCIGSNSYEKSLLTIQQSKLEEEINTAFTTKQYTVVKSSKTGGNEVPVKTFDDRIQAEEYINQLTNNYPQVVEMFNLFIKED